MIYSTADSGGDGGDGGGSGGGGGGGGSGDGFNVETLQVSSPLAVHPSLSQP